MSTTTSVRLSLELTSTSDSNKKARAWMSVVFEGYSKAEVTADQLKRFLAAAKKKEWTIDSVREEPIDAE